MESLLRGQRPSEIIEFSWDAPVVYMPIRHHSPACAWHLEQIIRRYQPQCILVEGPENANELISVLTHPDTQAPVALYYACRDEKQLLTDSADPTFWRCYYPFLNTSAELVALRLARGLGIEAKFMDLSYGQILLATRQARGLRSHEDKLSYASDRYLARSRFQQELCQRAGVRDFEEFWEKYFEAAGPEMTTERFLRLMHTYCGLIRMDASREELLEDGCLAREAHMASRIREASRKYDRVLVVAGGFHIPGLLHPTEMPQLKAAGLVQSVYPMRYSMVESDALNGYASGMPAPQFYETIWDRLHGTASENAWEDAVLDYLLSTGRKLRTKGENISAFDERCALEQALGLAVLRDKRHPGLYELRDAVLGSFVKGEATLAGLEPMRILREVTTGNTLGVLAEDAQVPPLTRDFDHQCKRHKLKQDPGRTQELTLSVLSEPKHRDCSRFLHQSEFLNCEFAARRRGPDLITGKDRNLIREVWEYRRSPAVDTALIEHSISGGTVREACAAELRSRMKEAQRAEEGANLLLKGFLMGLEDPTGDRVARMEELLIGDGDFNSLCAACGSLYRLHQWKNQYDEADALDDKALLIRAFDRVVQLLPSMHSVDDRGLEGVQQSAMLLYQLTLEPELASRRERLKEALERLVEMIPIHPGLHGAALGLLYGMDPGWKTKIDTVAAGYLRGTRNMKLRSADFLQGLFFSARDLLLTDGAFLQQIDRLFCELEDEDFIAMLPQLRLAFSYFLPRETNRVARSAAALHGSVAQISGTAVDAAAYSRAEAVDAWAAARLTDWTGGEDHGDQ